MILPEGYSVDALVAADSAGRKNSSEPRPRAGRLTPPAGAWSGVRGSASGYVFHGALDLSYPHPGLRRVRPAVTVVHALCGLRLPPFESSVESHLVSTWLAY